MVRVPRSHHTVLWRIDAMYIISIYSLLALPLARLQGHPPSEVIQRKDDPVRRLLTLD